MWKAPRAILIGIAFAIVTLAQLSLPDGDWAAYPIVLYGAVGLLALQEVIRYAAAGTHQTAVQRYHETLRQALTPALHLVATQQQVDIDRIGVHAFLARGRGRWRRLVKAEGIRLGRRPSLLRSDWRPGKGVVGRCWRSQNYEAVDWQRAVRRAETETRESWRALPPDKTYGISWAELPALTEYDGVVAHPVYVGDRQIGCVTVDGPMPMSKLRGPEMRAVLRDVAVGVAAAGRPPAAWWSGRA